MISRDSITRIPNYLPSDLYRWLLPLRVMGVLRLCVALHFVASLRQLIVDLFSTGGRWAGFDHLTLAVARFDGWDLPTFEGYERISNA